MLKKLLFLLLAVAVILGLVVIFADEIDEFLEKRQTAKLAEQQGTAG